MQGCLSSSFFFLPNYTFNLNKLFLYSSAVNLIFISISEKSSDMVLVFLFCISDYHKKNSNFEF